jgi:hypothetical protein
MCSSPSYLLTDLIGGRRGRGPEAAHVSNVPKTLKALALGVLTGPMPSRSRTCRSGVSLSDGRTFHRPGSSEDEDLT